MALIAAGQVHAQMAAPAAAPAAAGYTAAGAGAVDTSATASAVETGSKNIFSEANDNGAFSNGSKQAGKSVRGKVSDAEISTSTRTSTAGTPPSLNEFQKFVQASTGKTLPVFGANFFASRGVHSSLSAPVPMDYRLGPGDEVSIRVWGSVSGEFTGNIDREGMLNIPKIGTIPLAGVRGSDVEPVVRSAIGKYYRGFNLSVTLGQLRGITIYVVGQARNPGTFTVSSLSTVVTALFESGGPNAIGSLRHVQVKRDGRQMAELDLYGFLAHGDKSADIRLLDGDVIVIPPALGYVALDGQVEAPAIFELKGNGDSLQSILQLTGGLSVIANPHRATIERLDAREGRPRSVADLPLDAENLKRPLKAGDMITVLPIRPEFSNAVVLRGVIDSPIRAPFREGMKITDLIPNREFLLSRAAVQRQNDLRQMQGESIGNKYDMISWDYAVVERLNKAELKETLLSFNLGRALDAPNSADNLLLQPGDTVNLFSANDIRLPIAKRQVYVRVEGEVQKPGVYLVEPGESLPNIVMKAGGFTTDAYPFGAEFVRESVRAIQQENLDKLVRKLEQQSLTETTRLASNISSADATVAQSQQVRLASESEMRSRFIQSLKNLKSNGRLSLEIPAKDASVAGLPALRLENGDRLLVPNRPDFVQVLGAVNSETAIIWRPGRSVSDYLAQSGLTQDGDKDNMFVLRANGTVVGNGDRWITSVAGLEALPGDIIVVPNKVDKESLWSAFTRNAKDLTQILANFGLGAAAIKTLK